MLIYFFMLNHLFTILRHSQHVEFSPGVLAMIINEFLSWAENAPLPSRADGVSALARALLYSNLDAAQTQAAVVALAGFLDDPAPAVRRALADALASAIEAPRAIVLALAEDEPEIAAIVLSRSPVLRDLDLAICARGAPSLCQAAIASRPGLAGNVCCVLAETGSAEALVILAANLDTAIPAGAMAQMIERHGTDARLREALLARGNLPVTLYLEIAAAKALDAVATIDRHGPNADARRERARREAFERAAVSVAAGTACETGPDELAALAAHLRKSGRLTPAFACRVLLSGNRAFFDAILSELGAMSLSRVQGFANASRSTGFAALYRKAGLPAPLLPAFRLMLCALRDWDLGAQDRMVYPLVMQIHDQCAAINDGSLDNLLVMLQRFETEAARAEASRPRSVALAAPREIAMDRGAGIEEAFGRPEGGHAGVADLAEQNGWGMDIPAFTGGDSLWPASSESCDHDVAVEIFAAGLRDQAALTEDLPPLPATAPRDATPESLSSLVDHEEPELVRLVREPVVATNVYSAFPFRLSMQTGGDKPKCRVPLIDVEASMAAFEAELHAA